MRIRYKKWARPELEARKEEVAEEPAKEEAPKAEKEADKKDAE